MGSPSDKSSGIKSISTPSTPQADGINLTSESRLSHSLITEDSPVDLFSDTRQDREVPADDFLGQETPLVCNLMVFSMLILLWRKYFNSDSVVCSYIVQVFESLNYYILVCEILKKTFANMNKVLKDVMSQTKEKQEGVGWEFLHVVKRIFMIEM